MNHKKNQGSSSIKDLLLNYKPKEELPPELKKEVFKTIDNIELVASMVDLFTVKFVNTEMRFLGSFESEEEES